MSEAVAAAAGQEPEIQKNWRYYLGLTCLGLGMVMPLFALLILPLDLPTEIKATIMGALSLGGPEVALVVAAALLGKDTLNAFKGRIFAAIRRLLPSKPASKFRYYACLTVMLATYFGWYLYGYFGTFLPTELTSQTSLVVGDIAFVIAFIVAGPEFWEKIRSIFRWEGRLQSDA